MNQERIGEFLKQLRKEKDFTQEQLAEHFNVSGRTVSRWETGKNMPDTALLIELADFFDVEVKELLEGKRESVDANMTTETKETLKLIAEYSDAEQDRLTKDLYLSSTATVIAFLSLWIVPIIIDIAPGMTIDNKHSMLGSFVFFASMIGLIFAITGLVRIFQIKGKLSKNRMNRAKRILLPIIIGTLIICTIGVVLLAHLALP